MSLQAEVAVTHRLSAVSTRTWTGAAQGLTAMGTSRHGAAGHKPGLWMLPLCGRAGQGDGNGDGDGDGDGDGKPAAEASPRRAWWRWSQPVAAAGSGVRGARAGVTQLARGLGGEG